MIFRERKKEPPDPLLPPSASLIVRRSFVVLTISLGHLQRDLHPISFPCSWIHLPSSTFQAELSAQTPCVSDGLVRSTRWNSSTFTTVSIIQFRGLRSAIVERICQDGQICSICVALFYSLVRGPSQPIVGSQRTIWWFRMHLPSITIRAGLSVQISGLRTAIVECICRDGQICAVGVVSVESLFRGPAQFGTRQLGSVMFWKLAPYGYGFVLPQCRYSGSAGVFLKFATIASLTLICFIAWISLLFIRLLLFLPYHFKYRSPFILLDWPTGLVHSLLMVHVNLFLFQNWGYASLIQFEWRFLSDRVMLALIPPFSRLLRLFERVLDHHTFYYFLPECSDLDQHVYVLGPRPWTLVLALYGCWPFCSRLSEARSKHSLCWVLPLFLLPLGLVNLYAQNHVLLCTCFCWCLVFYQTAGDEVKGLWSIVFEDVLAETRTPVPLAIFSVYYSRSSSPLFSILVLWACLFGVLVQVCGQAILSSREGKQVDLTLAAELLAQLPARLLVFTIMGSGSSTTFFQHPSTRLLLYLCTDQHVYMLRMHLCMLGKPPHGGWTNLCLMKPPSSCSDAWFGPEVQLQASKHSVGMQDQELGNPTFMFWLYCDMYWVYMIDSFLSLIVIDKAVIWLAEIFSYLLYCCSLWFVWFVAQHCCVLGTCLLALEQHRRMLGLAHRGLGSKCHRTIDTFVSI